MRAGLDRGKVAVRVVECAWCRLSNINIYGWTSAFEFEGSGDEFILVVWARKFLRPG